MKRLPCILVCAFFASGCARSDVTVLEARPNTELSDVEKDVVSVEVQGPAVVFLARDGWVLAAAYQGKKEKATVILPLRSVASGGSTIWLQVNHRPVAVAAFTHDENTPTTSTELNPDICVECTRHDDNGEPLLDPRGNFLTQLVCCTER